MTAPIQCLISKVTMQIRPVYGNSTKNLVCAHTLKLTMAYCRSMTGQYLRLRRSWYLTTINVLLLTCHAALPAPTQVSVNKLSCARGSLPLEWDTSDFVSRVRASLPDDAQSSARRACCMSIISQLLCLQESKVFFVLCVFRENPLFRQKPDKSYVQ